MTTLSTMWQKERGKKNKIPEEQAEKQKRLYKFGVEIWGDMFWVLSPIIIFAIVQLIRLKDTGVYWFLLIGSIFTLLSGLGYLMNELINGVRNEKGILPMLAASLAVIPWSFGIYLVIFQGLIPIVKNFSLFILIKSLVLTYLAYKLVSKNYKLVKLKSSVNKAHEIIKKAEKQDKSN